jgi:predicted regulator of Ras-like GTPase activity (Roadblock/LC7/MglB family)/DNA-binding response OmpR family regulator
MTPTVLFLETDKELTSELMSLEDFKVVAATHILEAQDLLDQHDIKLIVVNTGIMEKTENKIYANFRSIAALKNILFIYLTKEEDFLVHRFNSFCIDVIPQPVNIEKLKSRILLVLSDQKDKLIYNGYLDDFDLKEIIKICEQVIFTGLVVVRFNLETAKLIFENGRLERAILNTETDWKVLDIVLRWRTGEFQLYGNVDKFTVNVFEEKVKTLHGDKKKIEIHQIEAENILRKINSELNHCMGLSVINNQGQVMASKILADTVDIFSHEKSFRQMIQQSKLIIKSLQSGNLDEIIINSNQNQVLLRKIGRNRLYFVAYFQKNSNLGLAKIVIQKYENQILGQLYQSEYQDDNDL